jgi:hypothetical protein
MGQDARASRAARRDHLRFVRPPAQIPQRERRVVAEDTARPGGKNRRHRSCDRLHAAVGERVHALVHPDEPAVTDPGIDRGRRDAEGEQLAPGDIAVLARAQASDLPTRRLEIELHLHQSRERGDVHPRGTQLSDRTSGNRSRRDGARRGGDSAEREVVGVDAVGDLHGERVHLVGGERHQRVEMLTDDGDRRIMDVGR